MTKENKKQDKKTPELISKFKKSFDDLGKKMGKFISNLKGGLKYTQEKFKIQIKKNQFKWLMQETEKWKNHPKTLAVKELLKKEFLRIQEDTSQIKDDTQQIKEDTSQILLKSSEIYIILENLDYKTENIEEILLPMVPMLEQILITQDNLEQFLHDKLGSKWKKLKRDWEKYKNEEISRGEFILSGFKILGKTFLKAFTSLSPQ